MPHFFRIFKKKQEEYTKTSNDEQLFASPRLCVSNNITIFMDTWSYCAGQLELFNWNIHPWVLTK
jgi:hypothetical protein